MFSICSENEIEFKSYYHLWQASLFIPHELVRNELLIVDYLKWINGIVLGNKSSNVRQSHVKAQGTDTIYAKFESIENSVYCCVDYYNKYKDLQKLFFEFLNTHPFIDSNGRTIKLIISLFNSFKVIWKNKCWTKKY